MAPDREMGMGMNWCHENYVSRLGGYGVETEFF